MHAPTERRTFVASEAVPGCYPIVGNGQGGHHSTEGCMVHNPGDGFKNAILPIAASYWVRLARRFLARD